MRQEGVCIIDERNPIIDNEQNVLAVVRKEQVIPSISDINYSQSSQYVLRFSLTCLLYFLFFTVRNEED